MSKITFSQAKEGYLLAAGARHLSEHTIRDYVNTLTKFSNFLEEDLPIEGITRLTSKPSSQHRQGFLTRPFSTTMLGFLRCGLGLFRSALFQGMLSGR